ncbi:NnrS family protein [Cognatishimia sp. WU-CL00825]|uniref:NnrS family protein n=1 Tax=Cognatishimia sp. WU-CL00825 TaxID=3127658 RepID=UPI00310A5240
MTQTSSERIRNWQGPAVFSYGFRPFFLGAALWAAVAMVLWVLMLGGQVELPLALDPVSWHAHAFMVGYVSAVLAGFLLTAVPNWTGRLPVVGWPLMALFCLWVLGRLALLFSALLPAEIVALIDLSFPLSLFGFLAREILAGRNWRNLMILALVAVFGFGNALFHLDIMRDAVPYQGIGFRLLLGSTLMMIAVVGGRIVPSFTRNWLAAQGRAERPAPPMQRFDKIALLVLVAALVLWCFDLPSAGPALLLAGGLHLVRLVRWKGLATLSNALLWVLHLAYLFVPLGALTMGWAQSFDTAFEVSAQHLWMVGAVGLMTLAVMARATLGHTGHALDANGKTVALFVMLLGAVIFRVLSAVLPGDPHLYHVISALLWLLSFGGFAVVFGPKLLQPKRAKKRVSQPG